MTSRKPKFGTNSELCNLLPMTLNTAYQPLNVIACQIDACSNPSDDTKRDRIPKYYLIMSINREASKSSYIVLHRPTLNLLAIQQ